MQARQNRIKGIKSGSMRQNRNRSTTPGYANASTCGFFTRKCQRAQGFRNLPHTSDGRFRKCGVKPRLADQTPVLGFRDLRFCCQKSGCARLFPIFPRTSGKRGPASCFLEIKTASATTSGSRGNVKGPWIRSSAAQSTASTSHSNTAQSHRISHPPWLRDFVQTV